MDGVRIWVLFFPFLTLQPGRSRVQFASKSKLRSLSSLCLKTPPTLSDLALLPLKREQLWQTCHDQWVLRSDRMLIKRSTFTFPFFVEQVWHRLLIKTSTLTFLSLLNRFDMNQTAETILVKRGIDSGKVYKFEGNLISKNALCEPGCIRGRRRKQTKVYT